MRKHNEHGDKSIAIYPGSFDPITNGHMDIIERATYLFDQVFILVAVNPAKAGKGLFTPEERVQLIGESIPTHLRDHIKVDLTKTLEATVDVCTRVGARAMIRGLRTVSDFDNEFSLAIANMELAYHVETVFMVPKPENHFISSSRVREILQVRGPESIKALVPGRVFGALASRKSE